ncbi:MAG: hypothetical protein GF317_18130 [Candidatus Lokiarchaeota archaeon]|nr:hypothetical protein [Candidatus Lokiarchaeota archaeon]MBD3201432.1 hypothetical protein [Candidatus Lokiarchaeota archaeon]
MLIDTHCHTNLYLNLDEILEEAKAVGLGKILCVGMSAMSQERVIQISNDYDMIYPALGVHPEEIKMNPKIDQQLNDILNYIRESKDKICAIGEIGLDYHFIKEQSLYPLQKNIFSEMLSLAQELNLPVNLHTKGAEKEIFETLPSYKIPNVNIHWYSGPENILNEGIDRGYYFSITPAIRYSPPVKKVVSKVESDHLLLESDGPVKYSGQIGTPAMTRQVLNEISKIKKIPEEELEDQIEINTKKIFTKMF